MMIDIILDQWKAKLGGDFSASVNHGTKTVTIHQIPEAFKPEMVELIAAEQYRIEFIVT